MLLTAILLVPAAAGLLCVLARSREGWERLNLAAFVLVAALAVKIASEVVQHGALAALGGFLRADALSALVIVLIAFVALASGIYAVGYFRRDLRDGRINMAQLRRYYMLTPLFVSAMLLIPLAD